ncbi:MAG: winged helix-turn-helix transcriptional regulator, partial [Candidatus Woesearchaeota archaeon]
MDTEVLVANPHVIFDYSYFGQILFRVYFKGGYIGEKDKADIVKKLSENGYVVSIYELLGEFDLAVEIEAPNPSRFNKELKKVASLIPTLNKYKVILNLVTHLYPRIYLVPKSNFDVTSFSSEIIVGGDRVISQFSENEMKIMHYLLENPKIRMTVLAKKSNLNIKTAISVFKELKKRKIIKGFKYTLDTTKLGIYKFRLFLRLHNLTAEKEDKLLEYFKQTKEIIQVNKTIGDWDLEVDIESFDKARIRYLTLQLREEFKELVEDFNLIEFFQIHKKSFLPSYLFQDVN